MSVHVPLCDLHADSDFAAGLDPAYLASLGPGYDLRGVNVNGAPVALLHALLETPEELQPATRLDRRKHTHHFLVKARCDRDMDGAVGLDVVLTFFGVLGGQVDNELRPAEGVHRPIGHLEGQIPDDLLQLAALALEGVLAHAAR